jgi:hypothetical protein
MKTGIIKSYSGRVCIRHFKQLAIGNDLAIANGSACVLHRFSSLLEHLTVPDEAGT